MSSKKVAKKWATADKIIDFCTPDWIWNQFYQGLGSSDFSRLLERSRVAQRFYRLRARGLCDFGLAITGEDLVISKKKPLCDRI